MFQPLSEPLQPGIRFLCDPLPAPPTARLYSVPATRAAIRAYHVPYLSHDWVRTCLFTGSRCSDVSPPSTEITDSVPFLVQACQQLWLVSADGVYRQFTCVAHTSQPSASTRYCSEHLRPASRQSHTPKGATLSGKLQTPPLPVTHVFLGYRWSHNESAAIPCRQWLDNDRQSFRSCLQLRKGQGQAVWLHVLIGDLLFRNAQEASPAGEGSPAWVDV